MWIHCFVHIVAHLRILRHCTTQAFDRGDLLYKIRNSWPERRYPASHKWLRISMNTGVRQENNVERMYKRGTHQVQIEGWSIEETRRLKDNMVCLDG